MFNQILEAQLRFYEQLLAKANVVGVAVGYKNQQGQRTGELALVAMVEKKKPREELTEDDFIPQELDGMKTDVYEVGRIEALGASPRDRYRPIIPAGVSTGHPMVTAGTLGAIVRDRTTGERLILPNNHVLAASNDALIGDPILQPGPLDGGKKPEDIVAKLVRFIPLHFIGDPLPEPDKPKPTPTGEPSGCANVIAIIRDLLAQLNSPKTQTQAASAQASTIRENRVDAAIARPLNPDMFDDSIRTIGKVSGTKKPELGMRIRKTGRTTDYTEGTITLINAIVNVSYNTRSGQRTARFTGQVFAESMSQGGDSGSLIVDAESNSAVGLLFAGSSVATIFTPIHDVLDALSITL